MTVTEAVESIVVAGLDNSAVTLDEKRLLHLVVINIKKTLRIDKNGPTLPIRGHKQKNKQR